MSTGVEPKSRGRYTPKTLSSSTVLGARGSHRYVAPTLTSLLPSRPSPDQVSLAQEIVRCHSLLHADSPRSTPTRLQAPQLRTSLARTLTTSRCSEPQGSLCRANVECSAPLSPTRNSCKSSRAFGSVAARSPNSDFAGRATAGPLSPKSPSTRKSTSEMSFGEALENVIGEHDQVTVLMKRTAAVLKAKTHETLKLLNDGGAAAGATPRNVGKSFESPKASGSRGGATGAVPPPPDVATHATPAGLANGSRAYQDLPVGLTSAGVSRLAPPCGRPPRCSSASLERAPHHAPGFETPSRGSRSYGQLRLSRMLQKQSSTTSMTPCNWFGVSVRQNDLTREKLLEILGSKKNLRYLDAQSNKLDADAPAAIMAAFPRIRHLDLSSNPKIGSSGLWKLCSETATARLASLILANCDLDDSSDAGHALCQFLQIPGCHLAKLDLSFNNLGKQFCAQLAQGLERNRSVRTLRLEHAVAYSRHALESLLSFQSPVHFHELNLARNALSFESLQALVRFLEKTQVSILNLSRTDLRDTMISKALRRNSVQTYILVGCRLPESVNHWPFGTEQTVLDEVAPMEETHVQALASMFARRRHLSLARHSYGRSFCQHLTRRASSLLYLVLDHSQLDDIGVLDMGGLTCLEHLSLQYNYLTAVGIESLMPLLRLHLQYLNVGGNKLRRCGAQVLAQELPQRSVDDFTLGVHQTLLTFEGVQDLWNAIVQKPLEALDLRRSQLKHPIEKVLPFSTSVVHMEVDLRDNPGLKSEHDLCEWAKKMNKVHMDTPLSVVRACQMLNISPTLVLKEPRISLLNCGIAKMLKNDTNVQVSLDNNELWRAQAPTTESQQLSPRSSLYKASWRNSAVKPRATQSGASESKFNIGHDRTSPRDSIQRETLGPVDVALEVCPDALRKKVAAAIRSLRRVLWRKCEIKDAESFVKVYGRPIQSVPQVDFSCEKLSTRGTECVNFCERFGADELLLDTNFIETFGLAILGESAQRDAGKGPNSKINLSCVVTAGDLLALNHHLNSREA